MSKPQKTTLLKQKNSKFEKWTTPDIVKVVLVYLLNFLIIVGIYFACIMLRTNWQTILDYFGQNSFKSTIHFVLIIALIIICTVIYYYATDRNRLRHSGDSEMMFLMIEISLLICATADRYPEVFFLRPVGLVAVLSLYLIERRTAVFNNIVFILILSLMDVYSGVNTSLIQTSYSVISTTLMTSIIVLAFFNKDSSRLQLLAKSFLLSLGAMLSACFQQLDNTVLTIDFLYNMLYAFASGPLTIAIFFVVLPIFEWIFNKVSAFKLAELTSHRNKIIKKIIDEAPGTFNHSITVSTLAEVCASAINEDVILTRACAYYHDVGKIRRPEYFSENQTDGINPHDDLTPELSTNIIRSHTTDGYNFLKKHGYPAEIYNVCREHHGTLPIAYFYGKAKKLTDGEVDINSFCYPGPKPQTKISAIIMIADGCEAAIRSLKDRSQENVRKMVTKIVNQRIDLGQFEECEITLKELDIISNAIVDSITGIYHSRVAYPKLKIVHEDMEKKTENEVQQQFANSENEKDDDKDSEDKKDNK